MSSEEEGGEVRELEREEDQAEPAAPEAEADPAETEKGDEGEGGDDKGADDGAKDPSAKDVFGEDDSEEEEAQPRKKSRLRQADSDDESDAEKKQESDKEDKSGGEGSGDEMQSPRKGKKKEKKKKEKKRKRGREEKEDKPKKRGKRSRDDDEGANYSDDAGSGKEASKEKRVFEESEDDAEERDEGIDLETGEVVASKAKSGKYSKKAKREMRERELNKIQEFVKQLKNAALTDRNAFKEKKMATKKLELLDTLKVELSRARTQQDYLENGILKSLKLWLDPLDNDAKSFKQRAASLPNRKLLASTLELILDLPMEHIKKATEKGGEHTFHDNMGLVEESEIGKSVRFVQNALESEGKDTQAYKAANKVREKWSRIIFKKSASYKKSADQMDADDDVGPINLPKANREWEKMPESVTSAGQKAVKGDYGFRFGASVPRPMLVDFTKQPETKIRGRDGREMDLEEVLERAKESQSEVRTRLSNIGKETVRSNTEGKNMRAKAPELNRLHVGGVAAKVTSMGWTERAVKKK